MKRGRKRGYARNVTCRRHLMRLELLYIRQRRYIYIHIFFSMEFGKDRHILALSLSGCTPHVTIQLHLVLSINNKWQWLEPVGLKDDTNARECVYECNRIYVLRVCVCVRRDFRARLEKRAEVSIPEENAIILATHSSSSFSIIKYTHIYIYIIIIKVGAILGYSRFIYIKQ